MRTVNVVVPCSASKVEEPIEPLRVRSLSGKKLEVRIRQWHKQLALVGKEAKYYPASEVYKGQHWAAIRRMVEELEGQVRLNLWIASAGLGLIPYVAQIPCYAATFTSGELDSITKGKDALETLRDCRTWWREMSCQDPLMLGAPRSLHALAATYPRIPLVIAMSASYMGALEDDIAAASTALCYRKLLTILSTGYDGTTSSLADYTLRIDNRIQSKVGGSLGALNSRVLRQLLSHAVKTDYSRHALAEILTRETGGLPPIKRPIRQRLAETDILKFIRDGLQMNPQASHSALLRQFRDSGKACERTRFRDLYIQTKEPKDVQ